jgi:hypothetical protein
MTMECYRVHVPIGVKVAGATAGGQGSCVLPGEYLVHRLAPKLPTRASPVLRFVGADPMGRDVHVTLEALRELPASLGVRIAVEPPAALHEAA